MESTTTKTGTVKSVEFLESFTNKAGHTLNKFSVEIKNGEKIKHHHFNAKPNETNSFPKKTGDVIHYIEDKYTSKIDYSYQPPPDPKSPIMTQQESIARSVAWNNTPDIVCTKVFQDFNEDTEVKTDPETGHSSNVPCTFSARQKKMIVQSKEIANFLYNELITKPK